MCRRNICESLTARIFLLTLLLLLGAGGLTFGLIAWATPITYTAVISDRLQAQVADLTQQLAQTNLADAGPILDAFLRESGAEVALTAPGGAEADTGSLLVLPEEDWQVAVTMSGADNSVQTYEADTYQVQIDRADGVVTATQTGILTTQITFADQEKIMVPDILVSNFVFGKCKGLSYESIRDFIDRMVDGQEFRVTLEDSRKTCIAILAIIESAEKGIPVEVTY